ncbi:hypothetical protein D9M68_476550 [compost metagenome]
MLADHQNQSVTQKTTAEGKIQTISGTGEAEIAEVSLMDAEENQLEVVAVGLSTKLRVKVKCNQPLESLVVGYMIKDRLGQPVFGTNTHYLKQVLKSLEQGQEISFDFDFNANLGPGTYSISIALHEDDTHLRKNFEWRDRAVVFSVINVNSAEFVGTAWIPPVVSYTL